MSHISDWLQTTLNDILDGKKVDAHTSDPHKSWLQALANVMYEQGMVTEEPDCFFMFPADHNDPYLSLEDIIKYKGDTSYHAISSRMSDFHDSYTLALKSQKGFYQAGLRLHDDWPDHKPIIIPRLGDFKVLKQLDAALKHRLRHLQGPLLDKPESFGKAPIFIDNSKGFWTDYLENSFSEAELNLIKESGVYITESLIDLKRNISGYLSHTPDKTSSEEVKPIGILVNTSNNKKIHELQEILNRLGVKATVIPFPLAGERAEEAPEVSYTYSGNNAEKMEKAMEAIQRTDQEELRTNLARFDIDLDNAYVLTEDRGLAILDELLSGPEFQGYQHLMNPYRPGPGVELAHLLKGMSIEEFYDRLHQAAKRLKLDETEIEALDITSYQLQKISGDNKVLNAFGVTRNIVSFVPERKNGKDAVYSENYLTNKDDPNRRRNSTVAGYIEKYSAVAKAVKALVSAAGLKSLADLSVEAEAAFRGEDAANDGFRITTQLTAFPNIHHSGIKGNGQKMALQEPFFLVCSDGKYDFTGQVEGFTLIQRSDKKEGGVPYNSTLNKFSNLLEDSDAFFYGKTSINKRQVDSDKLKIYEMFQFFSIVVGKQVFDPNIFKKPFAVIESAWQDSIDIYMDLHKQGLIGDKPEHIFYRAENNKDALNYIADAQKNYVSLNPHQANVIEEGEDQKGFKVAVYCSATSTNPEKRRKARNFGYNLSKNGMSVVNGGGNDGLMEEVSEGVLDFRRMQEKGHEDPNIKTFLKCIQCEETYRAEGKFEGADYSIVMPNIYLRMEELQEVDAEVVLSGGAGTVQEILGSIINRLNNRQPVNNRPLIIVNNKADESHKNDGVYDVLIKHLPESIIQRANIQVVATEEQAMDVLVETRRARNLEVSLPRDNNIGSGKPLKIA